MQSNFTYQTTCLMSSQNVVFGPTTRSATSLNQDSSSALPIYPSFPPPPGTNTVAVAAKCYSGIKLQQHCHTDSMTATPKLPQGHLYCCRHQPILLQQHQHSPATAASAPQASAQLQQHQHSCSSINNAAGINTAAAASAPMQASAQPQQHQKPCRHQQPCRHQHRRSRH